MIAFACLFILEAYQKLGAVVRGSTNNLKKVACAAQLMVDLALIPNDCAATYGSALLQRLNDCHFNVRDEARENLTKQQTPFTSRSLPAHGLALDNFDDLLDYVRNQIDFNWDPSAALLDLAQDVGALAYG